MRQSHPNHKDLLDLELTVEDRNPLFIMEKVLDNDLRLREFEFNSHGARVEGEMFFGTDPPNQLIVICHDQIEYDACSDIHAVAKQWAMRGALVAMIDLPLQGRRRNPKLTEHLFETIGQTYPSSSLDDSLWKDYFQQAIVDLRGVLKVLPGPLDAKIDQINFLGFGLGAVCGMFFCANSSENIRAALIGLNENTFNGSLDPFLNLSALTPESFIVGLRSDNNPEMNIEREKFFEATGEQKILSYSGSAVNKTIIDRVWNFFTE